MYSLGERTMYYWRVSSAKMAEDVVAELNHRDIIAHAEVDALGQNCVVTDEIGNMFLEDSLKNAF
jgi:hypothetical protein